MFRTGGPGRSRRNAAAGDSVVDIYRGHSVNVSYWERLEEIETLYDECAEFQVAQEAYWDEISRPGLRKKGSRKPNNVVPSASFTFLQDTCRNLFLYGYSLYRELEKSGEFIVPSGARVSIRFDKDKEKWVPDAQRSTSVLHPPAPDDSEYTIIILSPPTEDGPVSLASAAVPEARRLLQMRRNADIREARNSEPTVYATIDHNAMDKDHGITVLPPNVSPDGNNHYENLIKKRAEVLQSAQRATETLNRERSGYGNVGMGIEAPPFSQHTEHYVSDGRRQEQMRHLHGPADELHTMLKQRHIVLQAAGCPAQAVGETPSSERVSGAERSTGHALEAFAQRAQQMRNMIRPAVKACGLEFGKRMRPDMFERIYPLMRPESAVEVLSQMFVVTPDDFDVLAVAEDQAARRAGGGGKKRAAEESPQEERKTSYTKHADVEKRAEPAT